MATVGGLGAIIGAAASLIVGGTVAVVTLTAMVSGSVNSTASTTGDSNSPSISYGSTE